ncbi:prevent-host-death protein [Streptosporangium sp. NPDC004379]|uniref:prevent-host-death protein n=1 Tax=Streptosporangium sp. NPDC004379 TaxID=3366189 RepID=UPI00367A364D
MRERQAQEAERRFGEAVRRAAAEGAEVADRHGEEVAAVMGIAGCRRPGGDLPDLREFLLSAPGWDDGVEFPRDRDLPRGIDFR